MKFLHAATQKNRITLAMLLTVAALPVCAQSQNVPDMAPKAWRFQATPYVWMTGLRGNVRPVQGAPTVHVNNSFSEVLENLDAAFFLNATARKDRWVLHGDLSHAATSDSVELPLGLTANAQVKQSSLSLLGGYTWLPKPDATVDLMAGMRWWRIRAEVKIPPVLQASSNTSFVDPVLAIRWYQDWAPRWSTMVYGDVGGFGIGSHSTWQAVGTLNYQMTPQAYLSLGYRYLSVDYRKNGKSLDFSMSGPMLGATWRF